MRPECLKVKIDVIVKSLCHGLTRAVVSVVTLADAGRGLAVRLVRGQELRVPVTVIPSTSGR